MVALQRLILVIIVCWYAPQVQATWTMGLGYHNPPSAKVGLNLFYYSMDWGFEVGLGWADVDTADTNNDEEETDDTATARIWGGMNLKYFLVGSWTKVYIQGGFGSGLGISAGKTTSGGASLGGPYGGVGVMMGGPKLYVYAGGILGQNDDDISGQAGFGFDI